MSEWSFVNGAYGLTWIVLAGYAYYLWTRTRRAQRMYDRAHGGMEVER